MKLMTCPWWKHWVCGRVGNLTQVCWKLSYSFHELRLILCGMRCWDEWVCVHHPDHFSTELALLITCPPSLIEYLLNIWPPLIYSNCLSWLSLGVQSAALYSGRIPFIPVMFTWEQGQQLLTRLNHGHLDKEQIFPILAINVLHALWEFWFSEDNSSILGKKRFVSINDKGLLLSSAEMREKHIRNCIENSYSLEIFFQCHRVRELGAPCCMDAGLIQTVWRHFLLLCLLGREIPPPFPLLFPIPLLLKLQSLTFPSGAASWHYGLEWCFLSLLKEVAGAAVVLNDKEGRPWGSKCLH